MPDTAWTMMVYHFIKTEVVENKRNPVQKVGKSQLHNEEFYPQK